MDSARPNRRWFRFSLRALFVMTFSVAVTVWAGPDVVTAFYQRFVESERQARQRAVEQALQSVEVVALPFDIDGDESPGCGPLDKTEWDRIVGAKNSE